MRDFAQTKSAIICVTTVVQEELQRLTLVLAAALLSACGGPAPVASQPSPGDCMDGGVASLSWPLPQPAPSSTPPIVSAAVSGDTLKLSFMGGTPQFQVVTQPSAHFIQDPSGNPVSLGGVSGARILLTGFRGDQPNYSGPKELTSSGPRLLQVAELGDFEGHVIWGVGLSEPACANVTSSGSTLTFHFIQD